MASILRKIGKTIERFSAVFVVAPCRYAEGSTIKDDWNVIKVHGSPCRFSDSKQTVSSGLSRTDVDSRICRDCLDVFCTDFRPDWKKLIDAGSLILR